VNQDDLHGKLDIIYNGEDVMCPVCGEFDEGEPESRRAFRGPVLEQEWIEVHICPKCGQWYEYWNGEV
jgi:hypothetical protein